MTALCAGARAWDRASLVLRVVALLATLSTCWAGDIVLIHGKRPYPVEEKEIQRLADFYGLRLRTVDVSFPAGVNRAISSPNTLAVLSSLDALSGLDGHQIQAALRRWKTAGIPMLVFGVAAREDANELRFWSGGAIQECAPLATDLRPKVLEAGSVGSLNGRLAGWQLPAVVAPACSMRSEPATAVQTLLALQGDGRTNSVLLRVRAKRAEAFFVPLMRVFDASRVGQPTALPKAFSLMAPFIVFLRYAAGDYGWHLDGHYANLTIDDAWLTQPYGHLDYPALLAEMEKHNFHTTIAFIPWNFDRSKPDVVALFRAHPERYSICLHGNDHKHREFGGYARNSPREQMADIKQAVARMERFHVLTGIPYDRFMIFPQAVAPAETFAALKTYSFLGTANSEIVPLGASFPTDPAFLLRPYTVAYANFLSLSRRSQIPRLEIAIQSFLGNPILFYGHEDLFDQGISAFNEFADLVNQIEPKTQWTSLGEIARHLYLVRRRDDRGFDVRMLSNQMDLKNPTGADATFYIERQESASAAIRSLEIDGSPAAFERSRNTLTLRLIVPAGQVRKIRIAYRNDLDLSHEDIRKSDFYAYGLRLISDVRDLYISRFYRGRTLTRSYYGKGWDSIELYLEREWWLGTTCMALAVAGLCWYRLQMDKGGLRRAQRTDTER